MEISSVFLPGGLGKAHCVVVIESGAQRLNRPIGSYWGESGRPCKGELQWDPLEGGTAEGSVSHSVSLGSRDNSPLRSRSLGPVTPPDLIEIFCPNPLWIKSPSQPCQKVMAS